MPVPHLQLCNSFSFLLVLKSDKVYLTCPLSLASLLQVGIVVNACAFRLPGFPSWLCPLCAVGLWV